MPRAFASDNTFMLSGDGNDITIVADGTGGVIDASGVTFDTGNEVILFDLTAGGDDIVTATDLDDILIGGGGNDTLNGGGGDDSITASVGAYVITGGDGNDTIATGDGGGSVTGGAGTTASLWEPVTIPLYSQLPVTVLMTVRT